MSHQPNTLWLENAYNAFHEAIEAHDYESAKMVIRNVFETGFDSEAKVMNQELLEVPVNQFSIPSVYV